MNIKNEQTEAMKYVKSLKDAVKRRFAFEYLEWIRGGKVGNLPSRGALSNSAAKTVTTNLDALA